MSVCVPAKRNTPRRRPSVSPISTVALLSVTVLANVTPAFPTVVMSSVPLNVTLSRVAPVVTSPVAVKEVLAATLTAPFLIVPPARFQGPVAVLIGKSAPVLSRRPVMLKTEFARVMVPIPAVVKLPPKFTVPPIVAIVPVLVHAPPRFNVELVSLRLAAFVQFDALIDREPPLIAWIVPWFVQLTPLRLNTPPATST